MSDANFLFAYGSLSSGMVHFCKIAETVLSAHTGWVNGSAYKLQVGFPVIVRGEGRDRVPGEILELKASDTMWRILDEFHGFNPLNPEKSLYVREEVLATGQDFTQSCQIYTLNPRKLPRAATAIQGGDWKDALEKEPPLTERLSERQVSYIKRLGASTGREIVPIDMQLYRELMGLEIIVDKGRRLALSGLGQEVYRFLA